MRIIIVGAGAIGISIGVSLVYSGADVNFLVRGRALQNVRKSGLVLWHLGEEKTASSRILKDNPKDLDKADLIILAVKMYDFESALSSAVPMLSETGCVVTIQNGVEAPIIAEKLVGIYRVIAGVSWLAANSIGEGSVEMLGGMRGRPWFEFGCFEMDEVNKKTLTQFVCMLRLAGLPSKIATDVNFLLWQKFCLVAATSSVSALMRKTIGDIRDDCDGRKLLEYAVSEAAQVAGVSGTRLNPDHVQAVMTLINSMPFSARPSQLADLLIEKPLELEWISGAIRRIGLSKGVSTPYHDIAYAALKPYAKGTRV